MKKVLFLMFLLLLMGLGAASVKAQVRIGGDTVPHAAAVLDLNENNDATPTGNKGGLALPRVSLATTTTYLNGAKPTTGMLVYNTNASITGGSGVGIYFWDGSKWLRILDATASVRPTYTHKFDTSAVYSFPFTGYQAPWFVSPRTTWSDSCSVSYDGSTYLCCAATGSGTLAVIYVWSASPYNSRYYFRCYGLSV